MEIFPRKTKPEEGSSTSEDGSPLAPEPKRRRISGGGAAAAAAEEEEEDIQLEDTATSASPKKKTVQILKEVLKLLDQLEAKIGADKEGKKLISRVKKGIRAAIKSVRRMIDKVDYDAACPE